MTLISQAIPHLGTVPTVPTTPATLGDKGLGTIISSVFAFIGVLLIIWGIWKVVQDLMKGSIGGAVKSAILFGVAGALCLDLNLGISLMSSMSKIVTAGINTFTGVTGGTGTTGGTQP